MSFSRPEVSSTTIQFEQIEPRVLFAAASLTTLLPTPPFDSATPRYNDTSLTPVYSYFPTSAQIGSSFQPQSSTLGPFAIGAASGPTTAYRFGWKSSPAADDGASLSITSDLRVELPSSAVTSSIGASRSIKQAFWSIDQPIALTNIDDGVDDQGITLAGLYRANGYPIFEIRALSPAVYPVTGLAPILLLNGRTNSLTPTGFSLPLNEPIVLRIFLTQRESSSWSFDVTATYQTRDGIWHPLGTTQNASAFGDQPAQLRLGTRINGGSASSAGRWAGAVVSRATSPADLTDPLPIGSSWSDILGGSWYVDVEKTSPGLGTKSDPASVAYFMENFNGFNYPSATKVWLRNGITLDPNVYPNYTATSLADEFDAGTLTLHSDVPTVYILSKSGRKQRIAGSQIFDISNPAHVRSDVPNVRPNLWQTKALAPSSFSRLPQHTNTFQSTDTFSVAYLFQNDLPLATSDFSDLSTALTWVNAAPGRFWNSGSTLYVHPRNAVNPTTAPIGTFERSVVTGTDVTGVVLSDQGILSDLAVYGTAVKEPTSSRAIGAYAFGAQPQIGIAVVRNMLGDLADKHTSGFTTGIIGHTSVLWLDNKQGRSTPYGTVGVQTLRVDFVGVTTNYPGATYRTIYRRDTDLYPGQNTYPTDGTNTGLNRTDQLAYYTHANLKTALNLRALLPSSSYTLNITTDSPALKVLGMVGSTDSIPAWGGITITANPSPGQTITFTGENSQTVLTFVTDLTGAPNEVLIGSTPEATRDLLASVINSTPSLSLSAVAELTPVTEIVIDKSTMTAGGYISFGGNSSIAHIRDSAIFGVEGFSNVRIERSTLHSLPFNFSGTITDSHIRYSVTNPDNTNFLHRIPVNANYSQYWLRNTLDLTRLNLGSSTIAIHYISGSLSLLGLDNLILLPAQPANTPFQLFGATPSQVNLLWSNTHIVAPAGTSSTQILTGISAASHATSSGGLAFSSYSAARVDPATARLLPGSPLIGRGTVTFHTGDATGAMLSLRDDVGAYEFTRPHRIVTVGPRNFLFRPPLYPIVNITATSLFESDLSRKPSALLP